MVIIIINNSRRKFRNDLYDRRHNLNDSNKYEECCNCYAQNASTWFFIVFMICWITTLTSVTYVLHEQLVRLDANMKEGKLVLIINTY